MRPPMRARVSRKAPNTHATDAWAPAAGAYPNRAVALAARRPATSHGSSHPYVQAQRQRASLTLNALPTPVVPQVPRPRNPDFTDDMDVVWAVENGSDDDSTALQAVAPSLRPPTVEKVKVDGSLPQI
jgi:hypothetical protein